MYLGWHTLFTLLANSFSINMCIRDWCYTAGKTLISSVLTDWTAGGAVLKANEHFVTAN